MELKVWVEGIQRIVCGVTERTTCQDVVYALAHATGKTGRFTLIERWRNNERLLAPHEHPLKVLMKWGEYSNDVHFVLQRAPLDPSKSENNGSAASTNGTSRSKAIDPLHGFTPPAVDQSTRPLKTNIGIVKGVPQQQQQQQQQPSLNSSFDSEKQTYQELTANETKGLVYPKYEPPYGRVYRDSPTNHYSAADSPLVYPRYDPPYGRSSRSPAGGDSPRAPPPYRNPPPPSAVRNQPPPPYREPPRPRGVSPSLTNSSPVQLPQGSGSPIRSQDFARATPPRVSHNGNEYQTGHDYGPRPPSPLTNQQQAQLFQLLNRQREKLDDQHETMSQLDHEIQYFEGLFQEQQNVQKKRKAQQQELAVLEEKFTSYEDELAYLSHFESEWETLCNEESALKDEISSVRSSIAEKDSQIESHINNVEELRELFKERESRILKDLEEECNRLKAELEAADQRERELRDEEGRVAEEFSSSCDVLSRKKQDLEELIQEIKEANLQSLSIAPTEDLKNLLEGSHKTGHGRRMLGSPRQLENAVPTSKNPHGVWV